MKLSSHVNARSAGWFLVATVVYAIFFQALYNMLKHDTLLPYTDVETFALSFGKNYVPILLLSLLNVLIVFRMPLPEWLEKRILPKTLVDLSVSLLGLLVVNQCYLLAMGVIQVPSGVQLAGTLLSDILILLFTDRLLHLPVKGARTPRLPAPQPGRAVPVRRPQVAGQSPLPLQLPQHPLFHDRPRP